VKNPFVHIFIFMLLALGLSHELCAQDTSLAPARQSPPDSVYVNNIFIIGNEKTQKNIILRELDFASGYYYDWDTFLEILQADQNKI
jgi:hypothetical protein